MFRDSKKTGSPPTFPLYLLPSLSIPFRRRKTTPATELTVLAAPTFPSRALDHGSLSSTPDSGMPSLSSSPESVLSDPSSVTTPASPLSPVPGFFWNALDRPSSSKEPQTPRLTRTQPDTLRCAKCATDVAFAAQIVSKGFTGRHGRAFLVSPPSAASTPTCPASPIAGHPTPSSSDARSAEANLVNVRVGDPEKRQLVTGAHIVADINCVVCDSKLGWKYVNASEWTQKYKIGKFILETAMVVAHRAWEDDDVVVSAVEERRQHATRGHGRGASRRDSAAYSKRDSVASTTLHEFPMDEITDLEHGRTEEESEVVFDSGDEEECEDLFAGQWDARIVARRRSRQDSAIKGQYAGR